MGSASSSQSGSNPHPYPTPGGGAPSPLNVRSRSGSFSNAGASIPSSARARRTRAATTSGSLAWSGASAGRTPEQVPPSNGSSRRQAGDGSDLFPANSHLTLNRPYSMDERQATLRLNALEDNASAVNRPQVASVAVAGDESGRNASASGAEYEDDTSDIVTSSVASTYVPTIGTSATHSFDYRPTTNTTSISGEFAPTSPHSRNLPQSQRRRSSSPSGYLTAANIHAGEDPHVVSRKPPVPLTSPSASMESSMPPPPAHCLNPASEINSRLDTQVEVKVYPCNNNTGANGAKKRSTQFNVKPEGVIIQGTNRHRSATNDLGTQYALHIGRKLQRYELSDTRACQLLVTTHNKSYWVVPAPEAFSRHSGTCRLLGDRKHPLAPHTLQVGDFLRVGSVGVVVIETHNGVENRVLSEEKIQKIMKDTTSSSGGFLDFGETDGENSDDSSLNERNRDTGEGGETPICYMCFDESNQDDNPLISPCNCRGDTRYVHVNCLRKWHTAEADNQICFLSSVDATCSVCKSTFKSDFKLKDGRLIKLFKSSLEPPYVSLLVATKHEMAQRLFNTRFQLSFSTLVKPDGNNGTRALLLGRSSGSDMVLDYRTVSARHATIRFKNGEFIFTDAGSSNGSYLYLRRPVELTTSQPVQFRLGRSMISMKIVNKWNRRLLRAVRRTGHSNIGGFSANGADDHSVGSNEDDVRITDGRTGSVTRSLPRRSRESIMGSLPPPGLLSQSSHQHLDLLFALAHPKHPEKDVPAFKKDPPSSDCPLEIVHPTEEESKVEESERTGNESGFDRFNDVLDDSDEDDDDDVSEAPDMAQSSSMDIATAQAHVREDSVIPLAASLEK